MNQNNFILADGRWLGQNGIGRFSSEIFARLQHTDILTTGPRPLSLKNFGWLPYQLQKSKHQHKVFFIPGFNPVLYSPMPFVFTICDLIHLDYPGKYGEIKKAYYNYYIKMRARRAFKIITISEYSKQVIQEWTNLPNENIVNVSCGVSQTLSPLGKHYDPGFPYLLHVSNTSAHKNVVRLLRAFAAAKIDSGIKFILTGKPTTELNSIIQSHHLSKRVIFSGPLTEAELAEHYRGALAVTLPSLIEGFGLPVVEAMACGTPTLTSNLSSLPEVAGDAAVLINPYEIESIAHGIEKIVEDNDLRKMLITKGFEQIKLFTWDKTATAVQHVLNEASAD